MSMSLTFSSAVLKSSTASLRIIEYCAVYMKEAIRNKLCYLFNMRDRIGLGDQPEKEAFSATLNLSAEIVPSWKHGLFPH
jgi:hypothetical protein